MFIYLRIIYIICNFRYNLEYFKYENTLFEKIYLFIFYL